MDDLQEQVNAVFDEKEGTNSFAPLIRSFDMGEERLSLKLHFQLAPMFDFVRPKRQVYMMGRQVGKSYSVATSSILKCGFVPFYNILIVQPRFDQIKNFNSQIMKTMIRACDFKSHIIDNVEAAKLSPRIFKSGSAMYLEYCFMNPGRIRGISGASENLIDEVDDIVYDFIPIIGETMSASKFYGFYTFTGTPKLNDGTLGQFWDESSQAEWVIPCKKCNRDNIPSVDQHLLKMIHRKGLCCWKCGRFLDARDGRYVHGVPDRMKSFAGYHISQPIHPLHYAFPDKWAELYRKSQGGLGYTKAKFHNEVLGTPCDESVRLLAMSDIVKGFNKFDNTVKKAGRARKDYETYVMGVDWSGGGELEESYTSLAVVGIRPGRGDVLECVYAERLSLGLAPEEEARYLMDLCLKFQVSYFAHDYGGAGYLRESFMRQAGFPDKQLVPYTYVFASNKNVITYNPPKVGLRSSYSIDKARSLAVLTAMIRSRKVTLPKFDTSAEKHVIKDLLNLVEQPRELPRGNTIYLINRKPRQTDDFAHALNYACSAIWHSKQRYPNLAEAERFAVEDADKQLADPVNVDWAGKH